MDIIKRVHKNLMRTRVVSLVGRFGFYVQVKPIQGQPHALDTAWVTVSQWDYLGNAKLCAEFVDKGLSGGFLNDVHPN